MVVGLMKPDGGTVSVLGDTVYSVTNGIFMNVVNNNDVSC